MESGPKISPVEKRVIRYFKGTRASLENQFHAPCYHTLAIPRAEQKTLSHEGSQQAEPDGVLSFIQPADSVAAQRGDTFRTLHGLP